MPVTRCRTSRRQPSSSSRPPRRRWRTERHRNGLCFGVFIPPKHPISSTAPGPQIWGAASLQSSACLTAIQGDLGVAPGARALLPDLVAQTDLSVAAAKAQAAAIQKRLDASWGASPLNSLRTQAVCEESASGSRVKDVAQKYWYEMVATVADETYEQNEASLGGASTLTDLAGMISYLDKLAAIPKATLAKTTLVPGSPFHPCLRSPRPRRHRSLPGQLVSRRSPCRSPALTTGRRERSRFPPPVRQTSRLCRPCRRADGLGAMVRGGGFGRVPGPLPLRPSRRR